MLRCLSVFRVEEDVSTQAAVLDVILLVLEDTVVTVPRDIKVLVRVTAFQHSILQGSRVFMMTGTMTRRKKNIFPLKDVSPVK